QASAEVVDANGSDRMSDDVVPGGGNGVRDEFLSFQEARTAGGQEPMAGDVDAVDVSDLRHQAEEPELLEVGVLNMREPESRVRHILSEVDVVFAFLEHGMLKLFERPHQADGEPMPMLIDDAVFRRQGLVTVGARNHGWSSLAFTQSIIFS